VETNQVWLVLERHLQLDIPVAGLPLAIVWVRNRQLTGERQARAVTVPGQRPHCTMNPSASEPSPGTMPSTGICRNSSNAAQAAWTSVTASGWVPCCRSRRPKTSTLDCQETGTAHVTRRGTPDRS